MSLLAFLAVLAFIWPTLDARDIDLDLLLELLDLDRDRDTERDGDLVTDDDLLDTDLDLVDNDRDRLTDLTSGDSNFPAAVAATDVFLAPFNCLFI